MSPHETKKRKRSVAPESDLEDGGGQNSTPKRSSKFWSEDGNIILQAENVQFRVQKWVLSTQSNISADIFSLPPPEEPSAPLVAAALSLIQEHSRNSGRTGNGWWCTSVKESGLSSIKLKGAQHTSRNSLQIPNLYFHGIASVGSALSPPTFHLLDALSFRIRLRSDMNASNTLQETPTIACGSSSSPAEYHSGPEDFMEKEGTELPAQNRPKTFSFPPLIDQYLSFSPTVVLENSGSVARDHLASERTFLAYVRTSLALASTGVALVQPFTINDLASPEVMVQLNAASRSIQRFARPLGVTTVMLALVMLMIAVYRYFLVQHTLPDQKFPVARYTIAFLSFILGSLVVVVFGALLGGQ
ncbi:hypothetical protein NLJ89_g10350 [Agrocybe chaxingu]|uniref:DUF202 domain-containing protein n=1 Tax=Agrocybe chaxingu TaxID=84603 RepID=A0A9W8JRB0_9AGAR|nr:hypothetical protein NLJ89_g10350 [Agrocybe chaxingu]